MRELPRPPQTDRERVADLLGQLMESQLRQVAFRLGIPDIALPSIYAAPIEVAKALPAVCERLGIPREDLLSEIRRHIPERAVSSAPSAPAPFGRPDGSRRGAFIPKPPAPIPQDHHSPYQRQRDPSAYDVSAHIGRSPVREAPMGGMRQARGISPSAARAGEAPRDTVSKGGLLDAISVLDDLAIEQLIDDMKINRAYLSAGKTHRIIDLITIAGQRTDGLKRLSDLVNALPRTASRP